MRSVLIVAEYGSINGGENSLLAILPLMQQSGWQFSALVPNDGPFANALRQIDVEVNPFEFVKNGQRKPLSELREELAQVIANRQPSIVHCNSLSASRIVGPVCKELTIRSVGYFRDIIKLKRQAIADLNCLDRIVAVSVATRNFHLQQGIDAERIVTSHNGIDAKRCGPNYLLGQDSRNDSNNDSDNISKREAGHKSENWLHRELDIPPGSPLVLYVGQIGLRKGLDTWMNAAELIREQLPACHFLIVGKRHSKKQESIDYEDSLIDQANGSRLDGCVHWLGIRTDVLAMMRHVSMLLHCARQEPLGRVLLEAAAAGLPIVATDVGGTREILCSDTLREFLVPKDDPNAAAKSALKLLKCPKTSGEVAQTVRDIAIRRFSVEACAERLDSIYMQLSQMDPAQSI